LVAGGKSVAEAVRALGVSEATYHRWRAKYGGLKLDAAKRLEELERENARLKKAVADLMLEKVILKEAASGNY
jgi:transposase-like protein